MVTSWHSGSALRRCEIAIGYAIDHRRLLRAESAPAIGSVLFWYRAPDHNACIGGATGGPKFPAVSAFTRPRGSFTSIRDKATWVAQTRVQRHGVACRLFRLD